MSKPHQTLYKYNHATQDPKDTFSMYHPIELVVTDPGYVRSHNLCKASPSVYLWQSLGTLKAVNGSESQTSLWDILHLPSFKIDYRRAYYSVAKEKTTELLYFKHMNRICS